MTCPGRAYVQLVELVPIGQAAPPTHTQWSLLDIVPRLPIVCATGIGWHASHTHGEGLREASVGMPHTHMSWHWQRDGQRLGAGTGNETGND